MNSPEIENKPSHDADQSSAESAGYAATFKPKGTGSEWRFGDDRSVCAHPGENDELLLVYRNGSRETVVRLSKQAAKVTMVAINRYICGLPADYESPQAA